LNVIGIVRIFIDGIKLVASAGRNDLDAGVQEQRHLFAPLRPMGAKP
jgi:hypothetical protein